MHIGYTYICIHIDISIYIYISICMLIYTYICMHMYIYIYIINIYICMFFFFSLSLSFSLFLYLYIHIYVDLYCCRYFHHTYVVCVYIQTVINRKEDIDTHKVKHRHTHKRKQVTKFLPLADMEIKQPMIVIALDDHA